MPGPGGGGGGGGFGGGSHGGGFGGGFGGGGFHGGGFGPHGPHGQHHMFYPGMFWHPYYMPGFGGCFGFLFAPLICFFMCGVIVFFLISGAFFGTAAIAGGTALSYDEESFQDYANDKYFEIFGDCDDTEDQILLVVTVNSDYDGWYCVAWVGDDIVQDINEMFGGTTELGTACQKHINSSNYKYSLGQNLAYVWNDMAEEIEGLELTSSFEKTKCGQDEAIDVVQNNTDLQISDNLKEAMEAFTESTGISVATVIEYEKTIMPYNIAIIIWALFGIILLVLGVGLSVSHWRSYKKAKERYKD